MAVLGGAWRCSAVAMAAAVALAAMAVPAGAGVDDRAVAAQISAAPISAKNTATVRRTIALDELGIEDDLAFSGLKGRRALRVHLGNAAEIRALDLVLPYRAQSAFPAHRRIALLAGNRVLAAKSLTDNDSGVWQVPIPVSAVSDGAIDLLLDYAGSLDGEPCISDALGGDMLTFDADGALQVTYAGEIGDAAMRALDHAPGPIAIALPDRPSEAQVATAILLAASRPSRFSQIPPATGDWSETRIRVGASAGPLALDHHGSGGAPQFIVGARSPRHVAALFGTRPRLEGGGMEIAAAALATTRNADPGSLPLAAFDGDTAMRSIADRGGWTLHLPAARFPAGRKLSELVVDLQLAEDGTRDAGIGPAVVTATLNGLLLGSRTIRAGQRARLSVKVPRGLATTHNRVDVNVLRQEVGGGCNTLPLRQDAQLLASSHARFAPAGPVGDFHDLPALFAQGVTLALPRRPGAEGVAALAGLLSGMFAPDTPLKVRYGALPARGAAIWVADTPPPGFDLPMPLDGKMTRLRDADGGTILTGIAIADLTVAQLLTGKGRTVLWIRPGTDFAALAALPKGAELAYGNVALFDRAGRAFALHSGRERLVSIEYEGDFDLGDWMEQNRIWLVLAAWLAISALFAWLLRQTYLARRERLSEDSEDTENG